MTDEKGGAEPGLLSRVRLDQVGSLLRPEKLKSVYERHGRGAASDVTLREAQDEAILSVIVQQQAHDLPVLTDGEYRRLNFQDSFVESVSGFVPDKQTLQFQQSRTTGGQPLERWQPDSAKTDPKLQYWRPIIQRLRLSENQPLKEWRFAAKLTNKPLKVSIISPDRILENFERQNASGVYADREEYLADVVSICRRLVTQLADAGCPYIQIDASSYTAYVDSQSIEKMRAAGVDPMAKMERSMMADNAIIGGVTGVTFGMHLCRGNVRSMWHREGGYDGIAERFFTTLKHDRFLLEYDTQRAGGFEPLRFVPKEKTVVLGLVSTKVPALESAEELKRRIDEAARHLPLEQLALSPQCGFSSNIIGNLLSEDDQWRKFDLIRTVAEDIWGRR
ncbi:MAG TPA: methionine synthase [Candidatus Binatia bacterium]|nr:methionine synthase [Candidatus Binatia bacterium]